VALDEGGAVDMGSADDRMSVGPVRGGDWTTAASASVGAVVGGWDGADSAGITCSTTAAAGTVVIVGEDGLESTTLGSCCVVCGSSGGGAASGMVRFWGSESGGGRVSTVESTSIAYTMLESAVDELSGLV